MGAAKAIRRSTRSILSESGERDAEGYLLAQPGGKALAAVPTHSRHVRVNTLKLSVDEATRRLASHRPKRDPHVSDVLVFQPGTDLHDHPMVRSGEIVLQGKASCLPAAALGPKCGWDVVDCCAAPGNKTTHLAALVGDGGGSAVEFTELVDELLALDQVTGAASACDAVNREGVRPV